MKIFLFVSLFTFLIIGCKKDGPAVEGQPQAANAVDTVDRGRPPEPPGDPLIPPHARRAVGLFDRNLLRTHASAAKAYLTLPDSAMPVPGPPGARPFKNLKLKQSDEKNAFYTFTTATGRPGDMVLVRHISATDTIWIPLHILPK